MLEIVRPCEELLDSYLELCRVTWGHVHDSYILHDPGKFGEWKETIFDNLKKQEAGVGLPDHFVPSATFWIVENREVLGVLNVRLQLNGTLRRYGGNAGLCVRADRRRRGIAASVLPLLPAVFRSLGLEGEILLTCTEDNVPCLNWLEHTKYMRREIDEAEVDGKWTRVRRYYYEI